MHSRQYCQLLEKIRIEISCAACSGYFMYSVYTANSTPFHFKRIQFPASSGIRKENKRSTGVVASSAWAQFRIRMLLTWYVACSKVGKPSSLFIYTNEGKTKNIVYARALRKMKQLRRIKQNTNIASLPKNKSI